MNRTPATPSTRRTRSQAQHPRGKRSRVSPVAMAAALLFVPVAPHAQVELQEARLALIRQGQILTNTAASIISSRARDEDNDGFLEPPGVASPPTGVAVPVGGGVLPSGTAVSATDGYGTPLGYCAWDHGPVTGLAGLLAGSSLGHGPMIAVIFAGPNRVFDTTCAALASGGFAGGDDYVAVRDLNQTVLAAGVSLARPSVQNVGDLQALVNARNGRPAGMLDPLVPGEMRVVTADNSLWRFDPSAAGNNGAFVRVTSTVTSGNDVNTGGGNVNTGGGSVSTGGGSVDTGSGGLNVGGNATLANTTINGTLGVSGAAAFGSTVGITGLLTASGGISTTGVTASGTGTFGGLDVTGTSRFTGPMLINRTGSAATLIGNPSSTTTVDSPLLVNGATTVNALLTASGGIATTGAGIDTGGGGIATGSGNLTVGGLSMLANTTVSMDNPPAATSPSAGCPCWPTPRSAARWASAAAPA